MINNKKQCFIVAELSANHKNDINVAIDTIKAAKRAGANAIKLQTYTPETLTINCDNKYFQINNNSLWDGRNLYELYSEAYTPWDWHNILFNEAKKQGLICFSSPFDTTSVDFLEKLNCPFYKIASFEIQDISLIEYVAKKGKPVIISTGIANINDIELAIKTCRDVGNNDITILKCTSAYPAPLELANLKTINDIKTRFKVKVGFSDHTHGFIAPVVAVSLGATMIEKHFILNKDIGGPDVEFSLDEEEFTEMVKAVRNAEKLLGKIDYSLSKKVENNRKFSRSLFAVEDIKKDEKFSLLNVRSIRPGYGLHPKYLNDLIGKKAKFNIPRGTPIDWNLIS